MQRTPEHAYVRVRCHPRWTALQTKLTGIAALRSCVPFVQILNVCRALGSVTILFGAALLLQGSELMREYSSQMEYLAKRGKRGQAVHSKVERYETNIGAARVQYNPPPLWLLTLVHIALAYGAHYACQNKVLGPTLEITAWFANLVSAVHAAMAIETFACWMQARTLWKRDAQPAPVAVKAE